MAGIRTHPGEVLRSEYLLHLALSARGLAKALGVPANRTTEIVRGEREISADAAVRLARSFPTDSPFWLNLRTVYDLALAEADHDCSGIRPGRQREQEAANRT